MRKNRFQKSVSFLFVVGTFLLGGDARGQEKETAEEKPSVALASALAAACRQNEAQFLRYQTAENAAAFRDLPPIQKIELMKRLVQSRDAGRPLLSAGAEGRTVLRCEMTGGTTELRFGVERIRENLAFVPMELGGGQRAEFGMVREGGGWRMLSVGLVLMNIPELAKEWATPATNAAAATAAENSEAPAIVTLRRLAEAVETYKKGFGKLPENLAQLGPARRGEVSPEKANLIEQELAEGTKGGYIFRYRVVQPAKAKDSKAEAEEPAYALTATPAEYGKTGKRSFFLDASGELRGGDKQGTEAIAEDPKIAP